MISVELKQFLADNELPWLFWSEEKQKVIMVVDNHLLSTYRACPQHYVWAAVYGLAKKSPVKEGAQQRVWFLDFGILVHKMIELYYRDFRKEDFDAQKWATERATEEWHKMNMDVHADHKEYKTIGGLYGFVGLMFQFAIVFKPENEKIRVIAQEVSFGRAGEVPLYVGPYFEIYLAGRMDLIVDDGYFICPMDHKTMSYFRYDPLQMYLTDEGPTGYVYALSKILPTLVPEDMVLKRDCSKILMNLIGKKPTQNPQERFKRVPLRKTSEQLEAYRARMVKTSFKLLQDMEDLVTGGTPIDRNTKVCLNWMHYTCPYFDICRQPSQAGVEATIKNGYVKLPIWNTEAILPTE